MPLCWRSLWVLFVSIRLVYSTSFFNVTIDDQTGDFATGAQVAYKPVDEWTASPAGTNTTWHTSTFNSGQGNDTTPPTAEVVFYGSAVYVYCFTSLPASANMIFFVDDVEAGRFAISSSRGVPTAVDTNELLVYANDALHMGNHTFRIQNGGPKNGEHSLVMLDKIVYTTDKKPEQMVTVVSPSDTKTSKVKVLTGVLVTICILFAILLVYLLYRIFTTKAGHGKTGILPTSTGQRNRPSAREWVTRYLKFNPSKASVSLSSRFRSEGRRSFTVLQTPASSPAILAAEAEMQQKKSATESRWALVMSWRDRTVREAEMPSLPPTSNAPTTVFSGPSLARPVVEALRIQRPQQPQDRPETSRTQPRRMFTVMNV